MEKMDREMDEALEMKLQALQAGDDETGDGQVDLRDLKHQLDRVEAQLALQDEQNRRLLRNQKRNLILAVALVAALCVLIAVLMVQFRTAYHTVLDTCNQVNELAGTLQDSLNNLDSAELDAMMQTLPGIADKLSKIDVDALNSVMQKLPSALDTLTAMQEQINTISNFFGNLGTVFRS